MSPVSVYLAALSISFRYFTNFKFAVDILQKSKKAHRYISFKAEGTTFLQTWFSYYKVQKLNLYFNNDENYRFCGVSEYWIQRVIDLTNTYTYIESTK